MPLEQTEEEKFCNNLKRSHQATLAVANYLRGRRWCVQVTPLRIRPSFEQRHLYGDGGKDLTIWRWYSPTRLTIEVKRREIDFTTAEDFPYATINIDRVNKNVVCYMYVSTNRKISHAAIVLGSTRKSWLIEDGTDPSRGYDPYPIYRCPKELAYFVELSSQ